MMRAETWTILEHLLTAVVAGALIGLERGTRRPAGFRTHTLVCIASSALLYVLDYPRLLSRGDLAGLERPVSLVLLTAPSLGSDTRYAYL